MHGTSSHTDMQSSLTLKFLLERYLGSDSALHKENRCILQPQQKAFLMHLSWYVTSVIIAKKIPKTQRNHQRTSMSLSMTSSNHQYKDLKVFWGKLLLHLHMYFHFSFTPRAFYNTWNSVPWGTVRRACCTGSFSPHRLNLCLLTPVAVLCPMCSSSS